MFFLRSRAENPRASTLLSRLLATCSAALALSALCVGCVHVKPYEREVLSRPSMDPTTEDGDARFQAHLRESREGATASSGAAGGGCGCN